MQLNRTEVHIWVAALTATSESDINLLNADERQRATRLQSPLHQQRFIAAHVALRKILGMYLATEPATLNFEFSEHRKPSLAPQHGNNLYFNMSHSGDLAVYAITRCGEVGIDIEALQADPKSDVANRYFSSSEQEILAALPAAARVSGFFSVWAKKEAIIKANGKGFSQPLASFSVSLDTKPETISVDNKNWIVLPLNLHPDFAAALATENPVSSLSIWDFNDQKSIIRSTINLQR
jgi:4'-phosphopantetheinyl transferase